jgi:putative ABC transport system permease protein
MTRHLFKLIWNRKRANALVLCEISVSFLVLCTVFTALAYFLDNWRHPLGFDSRDVWRVRLSFGSYPSYDDEGKKSVWETLHRIQDEVQRLGQVEAAGLMTNVPYSGSTSMWGMNVQGKQYPVLWGPTSVGAMDVLRFRLLSGRWLVPGDETLEKKPIVITRNLARGLFADESPIGRSMPLFDESGQPRQRKPDETEYEVVGVVANYRRDGEASRAPYAAFQPLPQMELKGWPPERLLVRVNPGATAEFEETLLRRLHELAPDWNFDVATLAARRKSQLRSKLMPLVLGGTAAAFLIIMVGMGLMGVVWLNVTRRTRELGLRRALGATGTGVSLQILGELVALTTVAVILGALLFLQAPILGLAGSVSWPVYGVGIVASLGMLYTLVVLCGLYPSWLATRVHPAEALHYE